jgi:7-alpha-hydroxysteroid dehydrogenase
MILDRFKLTDQVALVTGGGKGIGRGIAWAFAEAGANVVVAARTRSDLDETVRGIEERGRRGLAVETDVTKTEDLERLVATTLDEFGRIDLLVNNAGGTGPRPALDTSERFFEAALRMNVTQAFLLTRLVVPKMVETAGGGAIVNISSRSSDMVQTAFVAYGAGKAALNMMTRNLAPELAPKVRINAISVGGVATESLEVVLTNDALREQFDAHTPMKRPGTVEDIAACALFLASPASGWVTGKIFQVDGGTECPSISVPVPPL